MSTRRAIRSTRTNRCGAPATRRSPASAVRTAGTPKLRVHTIPRRQLPGQGGRRRIVHSPRASGGRWVATRCAAGRRCRNSETSSIGLPGCRSVEASKRRASGCRDTGASLEDAKVRLSGQFICISREYELLLPGIGRPSAPPTDNPLRYASAPARSHPNPIVQPNENDTSAVRLPAGTRPEESAHGQKRPPHSFRLAVKRMPRFRAETATQ